MHEIKDPRFEEQHNKATKTLFIEHSFLIIDSTIRNLSFFSKPPLFY